MRGIAINPNLQPHYIDHLAVSSIMIDIPLLFTEESSCELCENYYPGLRVEKIEFRNYSLEQLIAHYDFVVSSDLWDRLGMQELVARCEKKYGKCFRHVHIPHGFSDKEYYLKKCALSDIVLLYGNNMIDQLKSSEVWPLLHHYLLCGNYRYTFFKQHRFFYNQLFEREVACKFDEKRPLILYAPTWVDSESASSFFDAYTFVLGQLPPKYNLLVKLHPRLELDDVVKYYKILARYENCSNILFLKDFPSIFPLLAHSDIYIGDMSSIGYDFLIFDKPLFFLNKNEIPIDDRRAYLFQCGAVFSPPQFPRLYQLIDEALPSDAEKYSQQRKRVWEYTFGVERPFAEIREELMSILASPRQL